MDDNQETTLELESFVFRGQTRYRCPEMGCDYDHYAVQEVVKHWAVSHKKAAPVGPTLFDQYERPILREQEEIIVNVKTNLSDFSASETRGADAPTEFFFDTEGPDSSY